MTTTATSVVPADSAKTPDPIDVTDIDHLSEGADLKDNKQPNWARRNIFPIYLLVMTIVMGFVLMTMGLLMGDGFARFGFAVSAYGAIFFFNLALMAYPAVKAFQLLGKKSGRRLTGILTLSVIGASLVVFLVIWLVIATATDQTALVEFGKALWGLRILGVVALILHAGAAWQLARSGNPRKSAKKMKKAIRLLPSLKKARNRASAALLDAGNTRDGAKSTFGTATNRHGELLKELSTTSDDYNALNKAFNLDPQVTRRDEISKEIAAQKESLTTQEELVSQYETAVAKAKKSKQTKILDDDNPHTKLAEAKTAQGDLITEIDRLGAELKKLNDEIDVSPEKAELDAAREAMDLSQAAAKKQAKRVAKDKDDFEDATAVFTTKSTALESAEQAIKDAEAVIKAARKKELQLWRDSRVWSAVAFVAGAIILYASFPGWVWS